MMRPRWNRILMVPSASLAFLVACDTGMPTAPMSPDSDTSAEMELTVAPDSSDALSEPGDASPFVLFIDENWGGTTTDVLDVDGEIVRFNAQNESLVWAADGQEFEDWPTDGLFLGPNSFFQVRFGILEGDRKAFFTETGAATICDIRVENDDLRIFPTSETVPQE